MKSWAQRFSRTSKLEGSNTDGSSSSTSAVSAHGAAALPACQPAVHTVSARYPGWALQQCLVNPRSNSVALTKLLHPATAPAGPSSGSRSSRRQQAQQEEARGSRHGGSLTRGC